MSSKAFSNSMRSRSLTVDGWIQNKWTATTMILVDVSRGRRWCKDMTSCLMEQETGDRRRMPSRVGIQRGRRVGSEQFCGLLHGRTVEDDVGHRTHDALDVRVLEDVPSHGHSVSSCLQGVVDHVQDVHV